MLILLYFIFYAGSFNICIETCLASLKCFPDICIPMILSSQSAEDFRNHFYN
jgi:hypothetical protein